MLPNAIVCAPKNGQELRNLIQFAYTVKDKAIFIRYPRANTENFDIKAKIVIPKLGSWEILGSGKDIAILAFGSMVDPAKQVCDLLNKKGISPTLVNARFLKPYDKQMLDSLAKDHKLLVTIEEACPRGGLRDTVLQHFQTYETSPKIHSFSLPDEFVTHGEREELMEDIHLTVDEISKEIQRIS